MCICVHFVTFIDTKSNLTDDNTPYATVSDEMARKNNQNDFKNNLLNNQHQMSVAG